MQFLPFALLPGPEYPIPGACNAAPCLVSLHARLMTDVHNSLPGALYSTWQIFNVSLA